MAQAQNFYLVCAMEDHERIIKQEKTKSKQKIQMPNKNENFHHYELDTTTSGMTSCGSLTSD
jgi:hypothetical protein